MGEYVMKKTLLLSLCLILIASYSLARDVDPKEDLNIPHRLSTTDDHAAWRALRQGQGAFRAPAQLDTTVLIQMEFDSTGSTCGMNSTYPPDGGQWTAHDATAQWGIHWHVDDYAGISPGYWGGLQPIEGNQSMWCGTREGVNPGVTCVYENLPGYGNNYDQEFITHDCLSVNTDDDITIAFKMWFDSETHYDYTYVQYDACDDNWEDLVWETGSIAGISNLITNIHPTGAWDTTFTVADTLHGDNMRFRFRFKADAAWSDERYGQTDGAVHLDQLWVYGPTINDTVVAYEDFEKYAVGTNNVDDWDANAVPAYGSFGHTFPGVEVAQDDPCFSEITCVYGFFYNSGVYYDCVSPGHPTQEVVPYINARDKVIDEQVFSPWIELSGTGAKYEIDLQRYMDLYLYDWMFSDWHVRSIDSTAANPCPGHWEGDGFVNYGDDKVWIRSINDVGLLIEPGATHIQISMDVVDYCPYYWCSPICHSQSPVYDRIEFRRIGSPGPQWDVRDIDQFQDNFSEDGSVTGTARADMATDRNWAEELQRIVPGDSAVASVSDPVSGLDSVNGKAYVYIYARVDGPHSATGGASLLCDARFNYISTDMLEDGNNWHKLQADQSWTLAGLLDEYVYCIDLCDSLFVPGDTLWYFWGAQNQIGENTYGAPSITNGQTSDRAEAVANADEMTILPVMGLDPDGQIGDILYVDGMNFRGAQPYFDSAFQSMNILHLVDRYDMRGPSSGVSNHPGYTVKNVINQLVGSGQSVYKKIIWNTGNLDPAWAEGQVDGTLDKSDDTGTVYAFLENLNSRGGIYLNGDECAYEWGYFSTAGAVNLHDKYMTYTCTADEHQPYVGYNPWGIGTVPPGVFAEGGTTPDTIAIEGGCPTPRTFDILRADGADTKVAMEYHNWGPDSTFAPAILTQLTENSVGDTVGFVLSGFSYHWIRDVKLGDYPARYTHMKRILNYLSNIVDDPVGAGTPQVSRNRLDQNVPNPFNPTTTIKYEVKESGLVNLRIYNVAGQLVKTLVDGHRNAGHVYEATWNGLNNSGQPVSSGVYFYKLVAKNFTQTKKMVLLK
jgi:hypothetical protein